MTDFSKYAMTLSGKYGFSTIGINQVREDISGYHRYMGSGWSWLGSRLLP